MRPSLEKKFEIEGRTDTRNNHDRFESFLAHGRGNPADRVIIREPLPMAANPTKVAEAEAAVKSCGHAWRTGGFNPIRSVEEIGEGYPLFSIVEEAPVDTRTLDTIMADERIGIEMLKKVVGSLLDGLVAIHHANQLHLNVCPEVIRVRGTGASPEVLLGGLHYTQRRGMIAYLPGDKAYSAPEALDEERITELTESADVYSVGMVAYMAALGDLADKPDIDRAFHGKPPLRRWSPSDWQTFKAPNGSDFPALNVIDPDFSPTIARLIGAMICRRPEDRIQTAAKARDEWLRETRNIVERKPGSKTDVTKDIQVIAVRSPMRKYLYGVGGVFAVLSLAAVGFKFYADGRAARVDAFVAQITEKRTEAKALGAPRFDPAQPIGRAWRRHEEVLGKLNEQLAAVNRSGVIELAPEVLKTVDAVLTDLRASGQRSTRRAEALDAVPAALEATGVATVDLVEARGALAAATDAAKNRDEPTRMARLDDAAVALRRVFEDAAQRRTDAAGAATVARLRDGSGPRQTLDRIVAARKALTDALDVENHASALTALKGLTTLAETLGADLRDLRTRVDQNRAGAERELAVMKATLPGDSEDLGKQIERMRLAEAAMANGDLDGADEIFAEITRAAGHAAGNVRSAQERAEAVFERMREIAKTARAVVGDTSPALAAAKALDGEAVGFAKARRWSEAEDRWTLAGADYERVTREALKTQHLKMFTDLAALDEAKVQALTRREKLVERHRSLTTAVREAAEGADRTDPTQLAGSTQQLRKDVDAVVAEYGEIRRRAKGAQERADAAAAAAIDAGADRLGGHRDVVALRSAAQAFLDEGRLDEAVEALDAATGDFSRLTGEANALRDKAASLRAAVGKPVAAIFAGSFAGLPDVVSLRAALDDTDRRFSAKAWSDALAGYEQVGQRLPTVAAAVEAADRELTALAGSVAKAKTAAEAVGAKSGAEFRKADETRRAAEEAMAAHDGPRAKGLLIGALADFGKAVASGEEKLAAAGAARGEAVARQRASREVGAGRTVQHRQGEAAFEAAEQKLRHRDAAGARDGFREAERLFTEAQAAGAAAKEETARIRTEADRTRQLAEAVAADGQPGFAEAVAAFGEGETRASNLDLPEAAAAFAKAKDGFATASAAIAKLGPAAERAAQDLDARLERLSKGRLTSDPRLRDLLTRAGGIGEAHKRGAFGVVLAEIAAITGDVEKLERQAAQMDCTVEGAPGTWVRVAPGQYAPGKLQAGADFRTRIVARVPEVAGRIVVPQEYCIQSTRVSGRDFGIYLESLAEADRERLLKEFGDPALVRVGNAPISGISQDAARGYAAWLSKKTGRTYRLPTPAEWLAGYLATASTDRTALASFLEYERRDWSTTVCEDQKSVLTIGPVAGDRSDVGARCQLPSIYRLATTFRLVLTRE